MHTIKGIGGLRKPKTTIKQNKKMIKNMKLIMTDQPLPSPSVPKCTEPRQPYNRRQEDLIRNAIIDFLKDNGFIIFRIENAFHKGISDLLVFNTLKRFAAWIEIKIPGEEKALLNSKEPMFFIRPAHRESTKVHQIFFRQLCLYCGWQHFVITSIEGCKRYFIKSVDK